ncbi:MAG: nucleotidyltransferase family protein [Elusimicrobia bacterium]|nr:nucleotidyltransferase family protein [Elusimicrobiota bacterium]
MNFPRVLLLAAGHGRRAGGPKAWMPRDGKPLVEAQLDFLMTVTLPEKIAVAIQAEWLDYCRELSSKVLWVPVNPDASPLASLQALIRASRVEKSYILHVDMPVFDPDVFAKLAAAKGDAVPSFKEKRGHPVLLTTITLLDVQRLNPETDRLDEFLGRRGIEAVPVDCELILTNLNGVEA